MYLGRCWGCRSHPADVPVLVPLALNCSIKLSKCSTGLKPIFVVWVLVPSQIHNSQLSCSIGTVPRPLYIPSYLFFLENSISSVWFRSEQAEIWKAAHLLMVLQAKCTKTRIIQTLQSNILYWPLCSSYFSQVTFHLFYGNDLNIVESFSHLNLKEQCHLIFRCEFY